MSLPIMLMAGAEEAVSNDIKRIFSSEYEIHAAHNEDEGFNLLNQIDANVMIVALNNSEMDGYQFLENIAQDQRYKKIPILAVIDHGDSEGGERAMKLGAREFVTSPLNETTTRYRLKNIIARAENEDHLQRIAEISRSMELDSLTGLYNRSAFYRHASEMIKSNHEVPYYIVYFDISAFKVINDLFHTETGNVILKTAGRYFRGIINDRVSVLGRIGADHFVICMPQDMLNIDRVIRELDRIMRGLNISQNILFFAGIYPVVDVNLSVDQMCDRASMALNKIKGNYITRYAYYDASMREKLLRDQMIVRDMEYALDDNQFTIYLQPIYRPDENKIVSAEALVRWFHPESGMISPGFFIPVFERNGFIVKLDRFVWESVCKFLRSRLNAGKKIVPVSVNVSRLNFYSFDLLIFLLNLIKKYELEPWMLKLEVTESAYMDNPKQIITVINQFKESGFPVLMDDFGAGYSSFNMLKDIQIDVLKVDMAFVREIERSERARTILQMIVALAQELKMGIVTEGVETKTQLDYIMSMGFVDIQGYYFSKPLPVKDFNELLDKYE